MPFDRRDAVTRSLAVFGWRATGAAPQSARSELDAALQWLLHLPATTRCGARSAAERPVAPRWTRPLPPAPPVDPGYGAAAWLRMQQADCAADLPCSPRRVASRLHPGAVAARRPAHAGLPAPICWATRRGRARARRRRWCWAVWATRAWWLDARPRGMPPPSGKLRLPGGLTASPSSSREHYGAHPGTTVLNLARSRLPKNCARVPWPPSSSRATMPVRLLHGRRRLRRPNLWARPSSGWRNRDRRS